MLVRHVDPEFGEYWGRASCRSSRRPRVRSGGRPVGRGQPQRGGLQRTARPLVGGDRRDSRARPCCDRAQRGHLRRRAARRAPERSQDPRTPGSRRARRAPGDGRAAAHRGRQLRQSGAGAADGWGRRRSSRRSTAGRASSMPVSSSASVATTALWKRVSTRRTSRSLRRRRSTSATRMRPSRSRYKPPSASSRVRTRMGCGRP